jgi:hypothetical protein
MLIIDRRSTLEEAHLRRLLYRRRWQVLSAEATLGAQNQQAQRSDLGYQLPPSTVRITHGQHPPRLAPNKFDDDGLRRVCAGIR